MRSNEERIAEVKRRIAEKEYKKRLRRESYLRIRTTFQITVQVALKKPLTLNYSGSVAFR